MHELVLILHSWVRWIAIVAGVLATYSALTSGASGSANNRSGLFFTIALDIQFLLGLILLLTMNVFSDFGATMRDPIARFYTVEHETIMIVAIALAHVGRVLARKALTPASARTRALICYGLATILLVVGTPWPGMRDHRPLFRLS
jgi:hypothetical protein